MSGGLALPPRQLAPPAPIPLESSDTLTFRVAVGIAGTVASAVDSIRRAAASQGIS